MRILLLCEQFPRSYRQGLTLRVLHFAEEISKRHTIDVVCFGEERASKSPSESKFFSRSWSVQAPMASKRFAGELFNWKAESYYPRSAELTKLLGDEVAAKDYDVVWDAGGRMFLHLPPNWKNVPLVVDLVDDAVLTLERELRVKSGLWDRLRIWKYLQIQKAYEKNCMKRAALCCVVSEDDASSFRRVSPQVPVQVIQNGVDTAFFSVGSGETTPGLLVFEGAMSFPPNEQAAKILVNQILPLLNEKQRSISVTLVGRNPTQEILSLASEQVVVTGEVNDVRDYVWPAQVFVCPLVAGAGIKNKLLQAWAMGKAVVATSLSVGGLPAVDGENILIRDTPQDIAAAVDELLISEDLRRRIGAAGRAAVVAGFDWESKSRDFEAELVAASCV